MLSRLLTLKPHEPSMPAHCSAMQRTLQCNNRIRGEPRISLFPSRVLFLEAEPHSKNEKRRPNRGHAYKAVAVTFGTKLPSISDHHSAARGLEM